MSQLKGLLNRTIVRATVSELMLPSSKWHIPLEQPENRMRLTQRGWASRLASEHADIVLWKVKVHLCAYMRNVPNSE